MHNLRFKTARFGTVSSEGESSRLSVDVLVVVIHGIGNGAKKIKPVTDVLTEKYPNSDVWVPLLPYLFCWPSPHLTRFLNGSTMILLNFEAITTTNLSFLFVTASAVCLYVPSYCKVVKMRLLQII